MPWIALWLVLAASPQDAARRHFEAGRSLYASGNFAEAATEFEAGNALAPRPLFLFNIAQALRRLGENTDDRSVMLRSQAQYLNYLRAAVPTDREREQAQEHLIIITAWLTQHPAPVAEPVRVIPVDQPVLQPPPPPTQPPPVVLPPVAEPTFLSRNPWFLPVVAVVVVGAGVGAGFGINAATTGCGTATLGCIDARR